MRTVFTVELQNLRPLQWVISLHSIALVQNIHHASIPVIERVEAHTALAQSFAYKDVAIGLISISKARYIAKVVINIHAAICPGPIAEMNVDSTNAAPSAKNLKLIFLMKPIATTARTIDARMSKLRSGIPEEAIR